MAKPIRIAIPLRLLERVLIGALVLFALAGLGAAYLTYVAGDDMAYGFVPEFSLEYEVNLPTWYSALLLLAAALVLAALAVGAHRAGGRFRRHWTALAAIFFYLSIDESAALHELVNLAWVEGYRVSGLFYYLWIFPAGALVAAFAALYWRFFRALPAALRRRVALAGGLYVGAALGSEIGLGFWATAHGDSNLVYGLIQVAQEVGEMAGASLFLAAMARHLAGGGARLVVEVGAAREGPGA